MLTAIVQKPQITLEDRFQLLRSIESNGEVEDADFEILRLLAALPADRFTGDEATEWDGSRQDLAVRASNISRLRAAAFELESTVPGVVVSWSEKIRAVTGTDGTWYARELLMELNGKRAVADGRVAFRYGQFRVDVPVKKGTPLGVIARRAFDQIARDQGDYIERGIVPEIDPRAPIRTATYLVHHCE